MSITMKELARVAGVSRATVDRALNQRGRIDKETAQRIKLLAEAMHYTPNIVAKSLASRHKNFKIAFVINSKSNDYFTDVINGVKKASKEVLAFGINVDLHYMEDNFEAETQLRMIETLIEKGYNSIAITPINDERIAAKLNEAIAMGIAIVAVTTDIQEVDYIAYIGCNHEKAGRIAANIAQLSCKEDAKLVVVIGSKKMLGHSTRLKGFSDSIKDIAPKMTLIEVIENNDNDEISFQKVSELLKTRKKIDFIFFATAGAVGGIQSIIENKKEKQIKIVSFDLTARIKKYLKKGIIQAVICQNPYNQGYSAIKILTDYLLSDTKPKTTHCFSNESIVLRESLYEAKKTT